MKGANSERSAIASQWVWDELTARNSLWSLHAASSDHECSAYPGQCSGGPADGPT